MSHDPPPGTHFVDEVLEATNRTFERVRHPRGAPGPDTAAAAAASHEASACIEAFWPHVVDVIRADPRKLGLSFVTQVRGRTQRLEVDTVREAILGSIPKPRDERETLRVASMLAPLSVMTDAMSAAADAWARELRAGRCPMGFDVEAERYVSLRALLHRRDGDPGAVGANAPTLVMGGTATALAMCWNLLYRIPGAWRALEGRDPTRTELEHVWADTRELVFRIGSGSLTAFVAFASACAPDTRVLLWDGTESLGLAERDGKHAWTMDGALHARYESLAADVAPSQRGQYVGCAALYTRTEPLPLDPRFALPVDPAQGATVFAELLRWTSAAAAAEFLPLFD